MKTQKQSHYHKVYSFILSSLSKNKRLESHLKERGILFDTPYKDCELLLEAIESTKKEMSCKGVAGFYLENKEVQWLFNYPDSFLIPLCNYTGDIHALKMRLYNSNGYKYRYISTGKRDGGANILSPIHYPIKIKEGSSIKRLRVTEGEIKADVCSHLDKDTVTVSMGGITFYDDLVESLKKINLRVDTVIISFDSDVYRNNILYKTNMITSLIHTYLALKSLYSNATFVFEKWDSKYGKGIDDVLLSKNQEHIFEQSESEFDKLAKKMSNIPDDWLYVIAKERFINLHDNREWNDSQFLKSLRDTKYSIRQIIANPLMPVYDSIGYHPQQPQTYYIKKQKVFNTFNGVPDICISKGNSKLFENHINNIGGEYASIIFDFLAFNIQKIGTKIMWCLLIQGQQGIGKSYIGHVMRRLLGSENISFPQNEELKEVYTSWAKNCCFCVIDELMTNGKIDVMNKLKLFITEKEITVREMYVPSYKIENHFNIIAFTNYKNSIYIEPSERRYCVIFSDMKIPKDSTYYNNLFLDIDKNAYAIKQFLLHRDLSKFTPYGHAPETNSKDQVVELSHSDDELFIRNEIEKDNGIIIPDIVAINDVEDVIKQVKNKQIKKITFVFTRIGCEQLKSQHSIHGHRRRLWIIRNHDKYKNINVKQMSEYLHSMYSKESIEDNNPLFYLYQRRNNKL